MRLPGFGGFDARRGNSATLNHMLAAIISLGANLAGPAGTPDATLAGALGHLAAIGRVAACSSLYSTAPVDLLPGIVDQPRFLNAALVLETSLSPLELLGALLTIEKEFGRDRIAAIPNGPRTLDLDIVLYGDFVLSQAALDIPHLRFAERAFVLVPLTEIAPDFRDPRSGRTVQELLQVLRNSLFHSPADATDDVVKVESDLWRAAVDGVSAGGAARANTGGDSPHR